MADNDRTYQAFAQQVAALLDGTAKTKGYNQTGLDGENALFGFVASQFGIGHPAGEIIYKIVRYGATRDPVDLLKISAWAFLMWRHGKPDG